MKLYSARIAVLRALLAFALFRAIASSALSPDPRLLPLVLPGSELVAGMAAPRGQGQPDSFLLITHNNVVDLNDFLSITGSDSSRIIHQVIFTASPDNSGNLTEHTILVSGQFDQNRIFRSTNTNSIQYRGLPVFPISPLSREGNAPHDLRWFTLVGSDVVVFGTVATVRQELDRYLAGVKSDASLIRKLGRLQSNDDTWCLLSVPPPGAGIRVVLGMLDRRLAESLEEGGSFQFGVRTRRKVEFEYEIDGSSNLVAETISTSLAKSLAGEKYKTTSFLPRSGTDGGRSYINEVVKVSRSRYEAWLMEVSTRSHSRAAIDPN